MNRLPKLIGAIIIFLLLCVFFGVYFFKYLPTQQQLLNGRAFRELEQIGNGLTNKNDAYTTAIHSYLKRRSAANPVRHYFRLSRPFPNDAVGPVTFATGPVQLEKNAQSGDWQLTYPVYPSSDTLQQRPPVTSMYTGLSPILQPIIDTYRDIFDGYMVFRDRLADAGPSPLSRQDSLYHYEVAFSSGTLPTGYQVNLDSLVKKDNGFSLITIHDVTIEGTSYKLFLYPLQLGRERIVLAGTIGLSEYRKGYNTLPFSLTVQVAVLVLLLLIHLPILKIYVLGNFERIRGFDIRTIIGTYFLAAFLTFFLFSRVFLNHVQSMHNFNRLRDLSAKVEKSFTSEIDQACRQLRQWDTSGEIWGRDSAALYRLIRRDTAMQHWHRPEGRPGNLTQREIEDPRKTSADSLLVDSLFRLPPGPYPYADYVYWIDSSGKWVATWNTKREFNKSDLLVVRDRSYFQDFMQNNLLILPSTDQPDSFTIQPTLSRLDGEYTINIVTRSQAVPGRPSQLIGLSTEMYSVCDPLLPTGYYFSIVDAGGNILYDSKAGRALLSNIAKETESPSDILAPLRYHSKRYFSSFILQGRPRALLVTPMKGFPYALLVYTDLAGSDDFQAHLIWLPAVFGVGILLLLILSAFVKEWSEKRPGILRTPVHRFEWLQPTHLKRRFYLHLLKSMLISLALFAIIWTIFEYMDYRYEFSLFFLSLLFPFYVTLHYYLLRERHRNTWPNAPLLFYLGIVIVAINLFACLGTRSGFFPLLLPQLAFIAGIILSIRSYHRDISEEGNVGKWRRYYVCTIAAGIFLINILPVSSIFWIVFRQESMVQANTSRLTMAGNINDRRTTVNQRIADYKLDLLDHRYPQRYSRDSLDLHRLKFQYGVYTLNSDTVTTGHPQNRDTVYPISQAYTQMHRWLFPGDSTALAWPANPNYASDSTWAFLHGEEGKWNGTGLLYSNQRDGVDHDSLLLKSNKTASFSAFSLMMFETFSAASRFYTVLYFGSILLIIVLILVLTWSLSDRIYLLRFLKKNFVDKNNGHLDHVLHRHRNAAAHTTVDDINTKEKQWWKDPVANEQKILDAVDDLHPFYAAVWEELTDMEKFTLYDFALDGFTNYKNKATLTDLINKQILRIEGQRLRFMTPGFREWMLQTPDDLAFAVINDRARQEGTWENTRRYLLVALAIPGLFIFVTQDDIYQKVTGFLTALTPLLPLLTSLFSKKGAKE